MSSSRNASKRLLIILALIALVGTGFGGYHWWSSQQSTTDGTTAGKSAIIPEPIFMRIEPFTINFPGMNNNRDRVLYIDITLRLDNQYSLRQFNEYLPEVRSRLLLLFSQQSPQILGTHDGKLQLMKAVKAALTPAVVQGQPDQEISDVLFTSFILR